jgi:hypothetical protein
MIPQHSSRHHLLCFMFHHLGGETVKQARRMRFDIIARLEQQKPCARRNGCEDRVEMIEGANDAAGKPLRALTLL